MTNNSLQPRAHLLKKKGINRKEIISAFTLGLLSFLFFSFVGSLFALFPNPVTINRFITVFSLSLLIGIAGVWNKLRPFWFAAFLFGIGVTGLMLAWAIHNLMFGVRGINILIWLIPLVVAYLIAWILPVIDPSLAKIIDNEQFAPKTKFGRGCLTVALSIGGAAGAVGALIARVLDRNFGFQTTFLVLGIGVSILTIAFSQTLAYQVYTKRLREMQVKKNSGSMESQ